MTESTYGATLSFGKLSWHPSWLFIRLGISANSATTLSLACGVLGSLFFAQGSYASIVAGAVLVNLYSLLDYVDGNVARYNNTTSRFGALFDVIAGFTVCALSFLAVGIGIFRNPQIALAGQSFAFLSDEATRYLFLLAGVIAGWVFSFDSFPALSSSMSTRSLPLRRSRDLVGGVGPLLCSAEACTGWSSSWNTS